jgi:CheY-like chemotaxis protein
MSHPVYGWKWKRKRKFRPRRERNLLVTNTEMNVMNDPSPVTDISERFSPGERAFRADLNQKLRAPLNAIIGFAELLGMRPGGSATKNADVQHILKAARDLLGIITQELGEGDSVGQRGDAPAFVAATQACDVLYIEDDPVNFTLVERILEFRPALKLMHARSGGSGVELAQTHRPRLILLDLNLPDMHGSEVLRQLQRQPATATVPVVVLSADATPSQIERLLTAGARNYLTKPFDIDPFLAVVDEIVS